MTFLYPLFDRPSGAPHIGRSIVNDLPPSKGAAQGVTTSINRMHAGALRALEFDRIVEVIRGFAQTPQGEAHLAALEPATDPRAVASALAATSETVRFLAEGQIAVQAPSELEVILAGIGVEGRPLEPLQLIASPTS